MGNVQSRRFLEPVEDWDSYVQEAWRSDRSRELDKYGGLERPLVARGDSMTAKLEFLQSSLAQQQLLMQQEVKWNRPIRGGAVEEVSTPQPRAPSVRSFKSHKSFKSFKSNAAFRDSIREENSYDFGLSPDNIHDPETCPDCQITPPGVACWRVRIHAARRRVFLTVLTALRFRAGLKHPKRMRRVDSFSYFIPAVLNTDLKRFVDAQKLVAALQVAEEGGPKERCPSPLFLGDIPPEALADALSGYQASISGGAESSLNSGFSSMTAASDSSSTKLGAATSPTTPPSSTLPPLKGPGGASTTTITASGRSDPLNLPPGMAMARNTRMARSTNSIDALKQAPDTASVASGAALAAPNISPARQRLLERQREREAAKEKGWSTVIPKAGGGWDTSIFNHPYKHKVTGQRGSDPGDASGRRTPSTFGRSTIVGKGPGALGGAGDGLGAGGTGGTSSTSASSVSLQKSRFSGSPPPRLQVPAGPGGVAAAQGSVSEGGVSPGAGLGASRAHSLPPIVSRPSLTGDAGGSSTDRTHSDPIQSLSDPEAQLAGSGRDGGSKRKVSGAGVGGRALEKQDSWYYGSRTIPEGDESEESAGPSVQTQSQLLAMFINRGNSAWVLRQQWTPPSCWDKAEQEAWAETEEYHQYKARFIHNLKAGKLAVQVVASEDFFELPGPKVAGGAPTSTPARPAPGPRADLWTADPWDIVAAAMPHSKDTPHLPGLSFCTRVLMNLVIAVETLAGRDAGRALHVVLHVNDQQQARVMADLVRHKFCGMLPTNVLLLVTRRRHGYRFDEAIQRFIPDPESHCAEPPGSGVCLMQLNWVAEALTMDAQGNVERSNGTVLELLEARGVEYLVSCRGNDLGLLGAASCMDPLNMSYSLLLRQRGVASSFVAVNKVNALGAKAQGGVLLGQASKPMRASMDGSQASYVAEVQASECMTGGMKDVLRATRVQGNLYLSSTCRYTFALSVLRGMLTDPASFRPKLSLMNDVVGVRLDLADILGAKGCKAIALRAPPGAVLLQSAVELDQLIPLLRQQDTSSAFRRALSLLAVPLHHPGAGAMPSGPVSTTSMHNGVVINHSVMRNGLASRGRSRGAPGMALEHPATSGSQPHGYSQHPHNPGSGSHHGHGDLRSSSSTYQHPLLPGHLGQMTRANGLVLGAAMPHHSLAGVGSKLNGSRVGVDGHHIGSESRGVSRPGSRGGPDPGQGRLTPMGGLAGTMLSPGKSFTSMLMGPGASGLLPARQAMRQMVVFVTDNKVADVAVDAAIAVARPGRDVVHLVSVVGGANLMQLDGAKSLLANHYRKMLRSLVETRQQVVAMDGANLLDTMAAYVERSGADLVILAHAAMSASALSSTAILGSVTLAAIKRLSVPVLVVTGNTQHITLASTKQKPLKALAVVQRNSHALVSYIATRVLDAQRGDTFFFGMPDQLQQPGNAAVVNRLLSGLNQIVAGVKLPQPVVKPLPDETRVSEVVNREEITVLGYALPRTANDKQGPQLPNNLVNLVHSSRSAVLVFKL